MDSVSYHKDGAINTVQVVTDLGWPTEITNKTGESSLTPQSLLSKVVGKHTAKLFHPVPIRYKPYSLLKGLGPPLTSSGFKNIMEVEKNWKIPSLNTDFRNIKVGRNFYNNMEAVRLEQEENNSDQLNDFDTENPKVKLEKRVITNTHITFSNKPYKVGISPEHMYSKNFNTKLCPTREDSEEESLQCFIYRLIKDKFEKQQMIDKGVWVKKGPGRNRKYQMVNTSQVRNLINEFFLDGFDKLNCNKYNNKRTDAWVTMYQRNLKKVTLFMLEKVSVRNKYKWNDVREYLVAYTETFTIFSLIFLEGPHTPNILERFLEFITIYYPTSKVKHIAEVLEKEGAINNTVKCHIHEISDIRDRTSK